MKWTTEPGYVGVFTREEARGAPMRNGSRIAKAEVEEGDGMQSGAPGTVLGSFASPPEILAQTGIAFLYFVEWDARPRVAVGVIDRKIRPLAADA